MQRLAVRDVSTFGSYPGACIFQPCLLGVWGGTLNWHLRSAVKSLQCMGVLKIVPKKVGSGGLLLGFHFSIYQPFWLRSQHRPFWEALQKHGV